MGAEISFRKVFSEKYRNKACILRFIASVALIVVVLLQSGKEAGLSGVLSGSSDSYLSKNKNAGLDHVLASSTKWIAIAWILLALALSLV